MLHYYATPYMGQTLDQIWHAAEGDTEIIAVDFTAELADDPLNHDCK